MGRKCRPPVGPSSAPLTAKPSCFGNTSALDPSTMSSGLQRTRNQPARSQCNGGECDHDVDTPEEAATRFSVDHDAHARTRHLHARADVETPPRYDGLGSASASV